TPDERKYTFLFSLLSGTLECVLNKATSSPTLCFSKIVLNSEHSSLIRVVIPIESSYGNVEIDISRIRLRSGFSPVLNPSRAKCVCAPSSQVHPSGQSSIYVLTSGDSSMILFIFVQYICMHHSPRLRIYSTIYYYTLSDKDSQLNE